MAAPSRRADMLRSRRAFDALTFLAAVEADGRPDLAAALGDYVPAHLATLARECDPRLQAACSMALRDGRLDGERLIADARSAAEIVVRLAERKECSR